MATISTYHQRLRDKAASYREMADWIERVSQRSAYMEDEDFLDLLTPYTYVGSFTVNLTVKKDSVLNPTTGQYEYPVDEEATALNVKKFTKACGGIVTKEYTDHSVTYTKVFSDVLTVEGTVDREAVCKPIKVEKVWHEPYTSKGYWTEEVKEWDCGPDTEATE